MLPLLPCCSGPVVATVWEGLGVVVTGRKLVGATNPLASGAALCLANLWCLLMPFIVAVHAASEGGSWACTGSSCTARNELCRWLVGKLPQPSCRARAGGCGCSLRAGPVGHVV